MSPVECPKCHTAMNGAMICPNCGWEALIQSKPQSNKFSPKFWNVVMFWAFLIGACGGCGFLAYASLGAGFGFGPLAQNPWARGIAIGLMLFYAVGFIMKRRRR